MGEDQHVLGHGGGQIVAILDIARRKRILGRPGHGPLRHARSGKLNAAREDEKPHPGGSVGKLVPMPLRLEMHQVRPGIETNGKHAGQALDAETPVESGMKAQFIRHFPLDAVVMESIQAGADRCVGIQALSRE